MKFFYHSPGSLAEYVPKYIFLVSKKKTATTTIQKARETKGENIISLENLTESDDIACEFALHTFSLLHRVMNFFWLVVHINLCSLRVTRETTVFVILQQHLEFTLSKMKIKENH